MMRSFAWARRGLIGILPAVGIFCSMPASAAILESYSISNSYGYILGSAGGAPLQAGGLTEQHYVGDSTPGSQSELGINYTATAGDGGFYFLHQDYCVGTCSVASKTVIDVTLKNTDLLNAVDLRFDSLITPGHLALNGTNSGTAASFLFQVDQLDGPGNTTDHNLYKAEGYINPDDSGLIPSEPFNGQVTTNPAMSNWKTIDWSATNLSLPMLTIDAGATVMLRYSASYDVRNEGACDDLPTCSALEIVFGDPRNDGSVLARSFGALNSSPISKALIGGAYDPYFVPFSFVPLDADPQADPPLSPEITYDKFLKSNVSTDTNPGAVPEPATWAMMLGGFGVAGVAMRRRRKSALTA
jgi:hypothetical protein